MKWIHVIYSDIDLPFFIMVQDNCFVRNVLFIGMFMDFIANIQCNVLQ